LQKNPFLEQGSHEVNAIQARVKAVLALSMMHPFEV
jgi:hypothetical protein